MNWGFSAFDSIFCIFHAIWNLDACVSNLVALSVALPPAQAFLSSTAGLLFHCVENTLAAMQHSMRTLTIYTYDTHATDIEQMKFRVTAIKKLWFSNLASICLHFHRKENTHSLRRAHIRATIIAIEHEVRHFPHLSLL